MIEIVNPLTGAEILAEFHNQPMDENFIPLEKMIDMALEDAWTQGYDQGYDSGHEEGVEAILD